MTRARAADAATPERRAGARRRAARHGRPRPGRRALDGARRRRRGARAPRRGGRGGRRGGGPARDAAELARDVADRLDALERGAGPRRVINATGVIVHTNLGRAPWPEAAVRAARAAAEGTLFLELDPETGRRGRRYREAEAHLVALTGAEDAVVVNNNAAAVALAVGLAGRRRRRRESRRARRDRRRGADPRDRAPGGRTAGRGRHDQPDACLGLRGGARGRPRPGRAPRPSLELQPGRVRRVARRPRARGGRPPARRDRRRRPRQWRAARHGRLRPRARAAPCRAPGRRCRPRHVQRRQARGRAPGGVRRGAGGPRCADPP